MHYRRDAILRVMGLLAFAAIATTSAALVLSDEAVGGYKYWLLCGGLALWGVAQVGKGERKCVCDFVCVCVARCWVELNWRGAGAAR